MIENLKYFSKLSLSGVVSFIKINTLGSISTIAVAIIGIINLSKDINAGSSAHVSAFQFLTLTFSTRPVGFTLLCLIIFGIPVALYILGNKYVISKLTNKVIVDKSDVLIDPALDKLFNKFKEKQSDSIKNIGDYSLTKLKLIDSIKKDQTENKWLRKIIVYGMQKVKIDEMDFNKEGISFYEIFKDKTIEILKDVSEPNKNMIWLTLAVQWLVLTFIWLTKF